MSALAGSFEQLYLKTADMEAVTAALREEATWRGLEAVDEGLAKSRPGGWILGLEPTSAKGWIGLQPGVLRDPTGFLTRISAALGCAGVLAAGQSELFWALQAADEKGLIGCYRSDEQDDLEALQRLATSLASLGADVEPASWMALLKTPVQAMAEVQADIERLLGCERSAESPAPEVLVLAFARPRRGNPRPPLVPVAPVEVI